MAGCAARPVHAPFYSSSPRKLLLFGTVLLLFSFTAPPPLTPEDIDGTLLHTRAGATAMVDTLSEVFVRSFSVRDFSFAGRTGRISFSSKEVYSPLIVRFIYYF
jgi:hypothetical protein